MQTANGLIGDIVVVFGGTFSIDSYSPSSPEFNWLLDFFLWEPSILLTEPLCASFELTGI